MKANPFSLIVSPCPEQSEPHRKPAVPAAWARWRWPLRLWRKGSDLVATLPTSSVHVRAFSGFQGGGPREFRDILV